ncbi:nose resistant to fluoxetine protein 6 [Pelomyxa schiedti]|nr:nose resistant to fluoxetine protein 6 [Pelomyxa schiedti]
MEDVGEALREQQRLWSYGGCGIATVAWCLLFWGLYLFVPLSPSVWDKQAYSSACHRIVAGFHGLVSTALALWSSWRFFCVSHPSDFVDAVNSLRYSDPTQEYVIAVTLGYFIADIIVNATDKHAKFGITDYFHHILCGVEYVIILYYSWALIIHILLQTNEMSTPFLHIGWFLDHNRKNGTALFHVNTVVFSVLFYSTVPKWLPVFACTELITYCGLQFYFAYRIIISGGLVKSISDVIDELTPQCADAWDAGNASNPWQPAVLEMIKASGKDFNDAGNFRDCHNIADTYNITYCLVEEYYHQSDGITRNFGIGMCFPSACNASDYAIVYTHLRALTNCPNTTNPHIDCRKAMDHLTAWGYILLGLVIALLIIHIIGTTRDALFYLSDRHNHETQVQAIVDTKIPVATSSTSIEDAVVDNMMAYESTSATSKGTVYVDWDSLEKRALLGSHGSTTTTTTNYSNDKHPSLYQFLDCFSLRINFWKMLEISSHSSLDACNGVRALAMLWIITGNTFVVLFRVGIADPSVLTQYTPFAFQIIFSLEFAVDTFLFLSGFLVAFLTISKLLRGSVNWALFLLQRPWRLLPSYALCILGYTQLSILLGNGPFWAKFQYGIPGVFQCVDYFWTNLLYINNFYPTKFYEQCMGWTWYLAVDMQLYLFSPLLIIVFAKKVKLGYIVSIVVILLNICYLLTLSLAFNVKLFTLKWLDWACDKPFARTFPYISGFLVAALLLQRDKRQSRSKRAIILTWVIGVPLMILPLFGKLHLFMGHGWSYTENALYLSLASCSWSIGLGLVMYSILCGEVKIVENVLAITLWVPLARLNYGAYLVHSWMISFAYYKVENYTDFTMYSTLYNFFGHVVMTYLVAAFVFLLVEQPVLNLEGFIRARWEARKNSSRATTASWS